MNRASPTYRTGPRTMATRPRHRRAIATLVVLLLISITLALSYSIMRAQSTAVAIQRNANLNQAARQAAMAGITAGLRQMHVWDKASPATSWKGVGTTMVRWLSKTERFEVRFATGDPSLTTNDPELTSDSPTLVENHPDREEFPYRVTLFSTGYAADPGDPTREIVHRIRAVVRLVPRKLPDEPAVWGDVLQNTVFQWGAWGEYEVPVPFRIQGNQWFQGRLELARDYQWSSVVRERYLNDLNAMTAAVGSIDFRPFDGRLRFPYFMQESSLFDILDKPKAIPRESVSLHMPDEPDSPMQRTNYQLYPGGKVYQIETISRYPGPTLEPDLRLNPLGLFMRNGDVRLRDNVTVRGTLLAKGDDSGDVIVEGRNIRLLPVDLPALAGSDRPVRLPVVVAEDDMRFYAGSQSIITGLIALHDEFEIHSSNHDGLAVSGTARIASKTIAGTDNSCALSVVDLNTVDPREVPLGAQFRVTRPGHSTVYTVTKRTPAAGSPTVGIEFTPSWGNPTPKEGDEIRFGSGSSTGTVVTIRGRVVARDVFIQEHSNWASYSREWWDAQYNAFRAQLPNNPYFPLWLHYAAGLGLWPSSSIKPEPANAGQAYYHWKNSYDPIYVPHPNDSGLRWELLEWTDIP